MEPIRFPSAKEIGCFLLLVFIAGGVVASLFWWIFS